jgi:hypothetical protein
MGAPPTFGLGTTAVAAAVAVVAAAAIGVAATAAPANADGAGTVAAAANRVASDMDPERASSARMAALTRPAQTCDARPGQCLGGWHNLRMREYG